MDARVEFPTACVQRAASRLLSSLPRLQGKDKNPSGAGQGHPQELRLWPPLWPAVQLLTL